MEGHSGAHGNGACSATHVSRMLLAMRIMRSRAKSIRGTIVLLAMFAIATARAASASEAIDSVMVQALTLRGLDGQQHHLSEWQGKVIVLNFWASWCAPCQQEIRDFVAFQERFATRGLQVIGVGLDEERRLRNVQRTLAINYPVLVVSPAQDGAVLRAWGDDSGEIPYTVVIDTAGHIAHVHRGPMSAEQIEQIILALLAQS